MTTGGADRPGHAGGDGEGDDAAEIESGRVSRPRALMREGGCACGAVRFRLRIGEGAIVDVCHCRQCRKASGAPLVAWVQVAPEDFTVTEGTPAAFASSAEGRRHFCAACGSPLFMTDIDGRSVGVMAGALDEAGDLDPVAEGWITQKLPLVGRIGHLPAFETDPPHDRHEPADEGADGAVGARCAAQTSGG
jgi:Uncharacterized conserved protein